VAAILPGLAARTTGLGREAADGRLSLSFDPVTSERLTDLACFSRQHGKFRYCSYMRGACAAPTSAGQRRRAGQPISSTWCSMAGQSASSPMWTACRLALVRAHRELSRTGALSAHWRKLMISLFGRGRVFLSIAASGRRRLTLALPEAAVAYARSESEEAKVIEGYPVPPSRWLYTYMRSPSTFRGAGCRDVTPPGATRVVHALFF